MIRSKIFGMLIALFVAGTASAADPMDVKGSRDPGLFTRMPGYFISDYEVKEFDSFASYMTGAEENWEGRVTHVSYEVKPSAKQASMLQIGRNYLNALQKLGPKAVIDEGRVVEGKIEKGGAITYIHAEAFNEGRLYKVTVVEKGTMKQDVTADAAALSASIAATGKATVYGIYFDTDKAVVKPESEPALAEITKLLKQDAGLKLYVVGHTDSAGTLDHNLKLSADRAVAVVNALIGKGVAAARLRGAGVGPYCPVASNRTDDGMAKNRRVELVQQ